MACSRVTFTFTFIIYVLSSLQNISDAVNLIRLPYLITETVKFSAHATKAYGGVWV
jgi:hypothetical protein